MKRLYLTVEGQTEAAFATKVLAVIAHIWRGAFAQRLPLSPTTVYWSASPPPRSHSAGRATAYFQHALADIQTWLKEDQSPNARF